MLLQKLAFWIALTSVGIAGAAQAKPGAHDLEQALYAVSSKSFAFVEQLNEQGISEDDPFYATAMQLRRQSCRSHEHFLRGSTLASLRADVARIHFHIDELLKQQPTVRENVFSGPLEDLKKLAQDVDASLTEVELSPNQPENPLYFWHCESGGYRLGLYVSPFVGRAFEEGLARDRSLNQCVNSPRFVRRCELIQCYLIYPGR